MHRPTTSGRTTVAKKINHSIISPLLMVDGCPSLRAVTPIYRRLAIRYVSESAYSPSRRCIHLCSLSCCQRSFVTRLRQPLRALVPDSVTRQPRGFPASVPALSVFAGDTAGVSVCCRVYLLLIALIASAFGLDFCSGSSRHSSPTEQALPECDQRYRLMQQA